MTNYSHHHANPEIALIMVGSLGAFMFLLGLARCRMGRKRNHYGPIDLAHAKAATQIGKRKDTLSRHIGRLENQLELRKAQLNQHSQMEEMVTSRVETARKEYQDDEKWNEVMSRGRQIYGDAWDTADNGAVPLKELMTMHKDDLLSVREEVRDKMKETRVKSGSRSKVSKEKWIERQNYALLQQNQQLIEKKNNDLVFGVEQVDQGGQKGPFASPRQQVGLKGSAPLVQLNNQWSTKRSRGNAMRQTHQVDDIDIALHVPQVLSAKTMSTTKPPITVHLPKLDFTHLPPVQDGLDPIEFTKKTTKMAETASKRRSRMDFMHKLGKGNATKS